MEKFFSKLDGLPIGKSKIGDQKHENQSFKRKHVEKSTMIMHGQDMYVLTNRIVESLVVYIGSVNINKQ